MLFTLFSASTRLTNVRSLSYRQNYQINLRLPTIDEHDDIMFNWLRDLESLSPHKKILQKVGCILMCNNTAVITATNSFRQHSGVHAELNAISQYLKIHPVPYLPLKLYVTYSPCSACAQLIQFIQEIKEVYYTFKYDELGIDILEKTDGIVVTKLKIKPDCELNLIKLKLRSYSKLHLEVFHVKITGMDGRVVLNHSSFEAFDVRPWAITAMRKRRDALEIFSIFHVGNLNHREKIFLDLCDFITINLSGD